MLEPPERGPPADSTEPKIRIGTRDFDPSRLPAEPMPNAWSIPSTLTTARTVNADVQVQMRLHGVTLEDVEQVPDIIMQEKLAAVIAKECGIPREWITHLALAAPMPSIMPAVPPSEVSTARSLPEDIGM